MKDCLICEAPIEPFISFGKMPLANGFLDQNQFDKEYFFELAVGFCPNCHMVQLMQQPDREMMFNEDYPFFSGTSSRMALHFQKFAKHVIML